MSKKNKITTNHRRELKIKALEILGGQDVTIGESVMLNNTEEFDKYSYEERCVISEEIDKICLSLRERSEKLKSNDNRYKPK